MSIHELYRRGDCIIRHISEYAPGRVFIASKKILGE